MRRPLSINASYIKINKIISKCVPCFSLTEKFSVKNFIKVFNKKFKDIFVFELAVKITIIKM